MITMHTVVSVAEGKTVGVEMNYDPEDPAAVLFTFSNEDGTFAEWSFGRDLLLEALEDGESGTCDVMFQVEGKRVKMGLTSPEGSGYVTFAIENLFEFVELIYEEVPEGSDSYEVPEFIPEDWLV